MQVHHIYGGRGGCCVHLLHKSHLLFLLMISLSFVPFIAQRHTHVDKKETKAQRHPRTHSHTHIHTHHPFLLLLRCRDAHAYGSSSSGGGCGRIRYRKSKPEPPLFPLSFQGELTGAVCVCVCVCQTWKVCVPQRGIIVVIEDSVFQMMEKSQKHDGCPLDINYMWGTSKLTGNFSGWFLNHNTHTHTQGYTHTYRETMKEKSVMIDSFRRLSKVTCVCVCVSIAKKESDGKRAERQSSINPRGG